jgi:hypothetical protein
MLISPSVLGIIVPPLKYGFPRRISSISPLVALIRDKKHGVLLGVSTLTLIHSQTTTTVSSTIDSMADRGIQSLLGREKHQG